MWPHAERSMACFRSTNEPFPVQKQMNQTIKRWTSEVNSQAKGDLGISNECCSEIPNKILQPDVMTLAYESTVQEAEPKGW